MRGLLSGSFVRSAALSLLLPLAFAPGGCLRHGSHSSIDVIDEASGSDLAGTDVAPGDQAGPDSPTADIPDTDVVVNPSETSSEERIQEALEQGQLDQKRAALYELLAQFSPERLPPEYYSATPLGGLPSIVPMRIAKANLDLYSATERAAVEAMLASPDDPEWLVFPPDMVVQNAGAGGGTCRSAFVTPSPSARVFDTPIDTAHFRIKVVAPASATAADKTDLVKRLKAGLASNTPGVGGSGSVAFGDYLDKVYEYYLNFQGMKDPGSLAGPAANGGRIPIYVALCDGQTNDAFAEPNDGYIFVSVGIGFEDATLRRVVLPHEIFHVFQNAYDIPATSRDWSWVGDASAVEAEDLVAPDVRRWSGAYASSPLLPAGFANPMDRSFQCPEEPLHTDYLGRCKHRTDSGKHYAGAYSKFVVFKFLIQNYGLRMGEFWTKLKAAGGDPRGLFDDQSIGQMQLALLGDLAGRNPYFDSGDRAAFFTAGTTSVDLPASNPDRYTYRMDPGAYGKSVAYRIAPSMDSSLSQTLKRLDNSSQPIQPGGGTQRILLEVPDAIASMPPGSCGATFAYLAYIEFTNCAQCTVNMVEVTPDGSGPGRSFDASADDADAMASSYSIPYKQWSVDEGNPVPRFLLAVITNHGSGAATFKAGLTVQTACTGDCMKEYESVIQGLQCPELWCSDPCVDAGTCAQWHQNCLDSYKENLLTMPGTYCIYICHGNPYPYKEESNPDCQRWLKPICDQSGVADCKTSPSAFIPVPAWPTARCQTFMISDEEKECK